MLQLQYFFTNKINWVSFEMLAKTGIVLFQNGPEVFDTFVKINIQHVLVTDMPANPRRVAFV